MNRKGELFVFYMILLGITLSACRKDFLKVIPEGSKIASSTADYDLLLNGKALYQYDNGGWQGEALMGDEVAAEAAPFKIATAITQKTFRWDNNVYLPDSFVPGLRANLTNLYTLNKVINEVMDSQGGTDQQKIALMAEARAGRAWINFQLINAYGKPYTAATAAGDPGFPIVTAADVNGNNYKRNTVQEVYDAIISDFTYAINNLPVNSPFATRFSKAAAEGLLGKVYLFMGKPAVALPLFEAAFRDIAGKSEPPVLYDYNKEFAAGGKFIPIQFNGPNNAPGLNPADFTEAILFKVFYNGSANGNELGNDFIVLSPKATVLFGSSDLRLNFYGAYFPYQQVNLSGRLSKYAAQYGRFGLELPDLLLMRAEVKARTGDLAGAKTDTETLRFNRMPAADAPVPSAIASDQIALIRFILDERIREFATQGYRWFDMRRLSVDPLFSGEIYTHILYNDISSNNTIIYTLRKERFTQQIPPFILLGNPGFTDNP